MSREISYVIIGLLLGCAVTFGIMSVALVNKKETDREDETRTDTGDGAVEQEKPQEHSMDLRGYKERLLHRYEKIAKNYDKKGETMDEVDEMIEPVEPMENVTTGKIRLIDEEEWANSLEHCSAESLVWFVKDDVMCIEGGKDGLDVIGPNTRDIYFGKVLEPYKGKSDWEVLYVNNEKIGSVFEVHRADSSYELTDD